MAVIKVEAADVKFSSKPADTLEATSLGSCIGLAIYDPVIRTGGVLVCALPGDSEPDSSNHLNYPFLYVNTAIPHFLQAAIEKGIQPERAKIILAGGGQLPEQHGEFDLGSKNSRSALEALAHFGLEPLHQSIGGAFNRSLSLEIKTGATCIRDAGEEIECL